MLFLGALRNVLRFEFMQMGKGQGKGVWVASKSMKVETASRSI